MKVTNDNIFPGAVIKSPKGDSLVVYKVNGTTFYAGAYSFQDYGDMLAVKMKAMTYAKFCSSKKIKHCKYTDSYEIDEAEASRKEVMTANTKASKRKPIGKAGILALNAFLSTCDKAKKSPVLRPLEVGEKTYRIMAQNSEANLVSVDGDYVLYDVSNGEMVDLGSVLDIKFTEKDIPWWKLSRFTA